MSMNTTTVLIDNTTIAGAGRAIYITSRTDAGGTSHAEEYYSQYPDALAIDSISLAELLTAYFPHIGLAISVRRNILGT